MSMYLLLNSDMVCRAQEGTLEVLAARTLAYLVSEGFELPNGDPVSEDDHIVYRPLTERVNSLPCTSNESLVPYLLRDGRVYAIDFYVIDIDSKEQFPVTRTPSNEYRYNPYFN